MPIQILPPQLANQIAAGEVVERPASVVKELVENSLDAGANQIHIEIEKGGAQLIRIRDNGIGIAKQELSLALARHATSKISCLDDLESILSLGFRGEALASISSVSRLTLTSRTAEQSEAWQVYAQGRDMETTIKPASHPVGTTVDVANLFFNTPARRKFLRSDKTEFSHIDEVVRRIALAKPNIAFNLSHNGKTIRHYKSAVNYSQHLKRIAAICGQDFIDNALHIDWKHDNLHLSGWVALPYFSRPQNDLAYCYVNGRMVRDKIITHAIRQAYNEFLPNEQFPAFVLFIDLNPTEVDVNVHPTKHEVRFHQSRLVHDFIYQGILNALQTENELPITNTNTDNQIEEPQAQWNNTKPNRAAAGENIFAQPRHSFNQGSYSRFSNSEKFSHFTPHFDTPKISKSAVKNYTELLQSPIEQNNNPITETENNKPVQAPALLKVLALIEQKALLLQKEQTIYLLPLLKLQKLFYQQTFLLEQKLTQPLLIPLVFRLTEDQIQQWQQKQSYFAQMGFEFHPHLNQKRITLNQVPACLRQQNLQHLIIGILPLACSDYAEFIDLVCEHIQFDVISELAQGISLLTQTEKMLKQQGNVQLEQLLIPVDFSAYLT